MSSITVHYFTSPYFLDNALEIVSLISSEKKIHFHLVVNGYNKSATCLEISKDIPKCKTIEDDECFDYIDNWSIIRRYLSGCIHVSVHFFPDNAFNARGVFFSLNLVRKLGKRNILFLENPSLQMLPMFALYRAKRKLLSIHDPEPHSGEFDWRNTVPVTFCKMISDKFITWSSYSRECLQKTYGARKEIIALHLLPYTIYTNSAERKPYELDQIELQGPVILYFGRVSEYKGIDSLISAHLGLMKSGYSETLILAGKRGGRYKLRTDIQDRHNHIVHIDRFINNKEMAYLFRVADLVILPYKDASQSGVFMTASAFGILTVASNVGGIPEQIALYGNGVVYKQEEYGALIDAIKIALKSDPESKGKCNQICTELKESVKEAVKRNFLKVLK